MTRRADFETAVRRGRRAGRSRLVAHAVIGGPAVGDASRVGLAVDDPSAHAAGDPSAHAADGPAAAADPGTAAVTSGAAPGVGPTRVGFVVGKGVGGSVVRHRVQRRLRHVVRDRLASLPAGTLLVVRALPPAAAATSADLAADLDSALRRLGVAVVSTTDPVGSTVDIGGGAPERERAAERDGSP